MTWDVEYTDEFFAWWGTLSEREEQSVLAAVEFLETRGPGLGRPMVDTIRGSRHANMKELRPRGGNIRILFAFDPRRIAILLIGGDKTDRWQEWYGEMIPLADALYDAHLREIATEGGN
ncbi:MAG: type II toxin-antitoxin system RelE/ParE family toxin [Dehalococcoidia bacterium]